MRQIVRMQWENSIISRTFLSKMLHHNLILRNIRQSDKFKLRDHLKNIWPEIFKSVRKKKKSVSHRNQGKTKELFQTEGNQRDKTTAHNV